MCESKLICSCQQKHKQIQNVKLQTHLPHFVHSWSELLPVWGLNGFSPPLELKRNTCGVQLYVVLAAMWPGLQKDRKFQKLSRNFGKFLQIFGPFATLDMTWLCTSCPVCDHHILLFWLDNYVFENTLQVFSAISKQPYHPAAQDWLPTEAKQGWAWSVPGWETSWEN